MIASRDTLAPPARVIGPLLAGALFEAVAAGIALLPGTLEPGWYGRGALLRAVHALTLGALALSITGAGWQLVPVIAVRPLSARHAPMVNASLIVGILALLTGFGLPGSALGHLGAGLVVGALALRSLTVLPALVRASGRRAARAWVLGGELALWAGLGWGLALWSGRSGHPLLADPVAGIARHASLLLVGWVGGWIIGTGSLLLPMFAVAGEPDPRWMGGAALCWGAGLALGLPALWAIGLVAGALGLVAVLARGARRGPALAQAGLGLLGVLVACALAAIPGVSGETALTVGLVLGAAPLLRGVAQRIVPFFAWTWAHGDRLRGAPPISTLTQTGWQWAQLALGLAGGAVLILGRLSGRESLARLGALLWLAAALTQLRILTRALLIAIRDRIRGQALAGTERT